MLLPARMAVLNYLSTVSNASINEIMAAMKPMYGGEGQFTKELYLDHTMSLEANGLCDMTSYELDKTGDLSLRFEINDAGRDAVTRYVPDRFKK